MRYLCARTLRKVLIERDITTPRQRICATTVTCTIELATVDKQQGQPVGLKNHPFVQQNI